MPTVRFVAVLFDGSIKCGRHPADHQRKFHVGKQGYVNHRRRPQQAHEFYQAKTEHHRHFRYHQRLPASQCDPEACNALPNASATTSPGFCAPDTVRIPACAVISVAIQRFASVLRFEKAGLANVQLTDRILC